MRTTLDIDSKLINEAMATGHYKTKTELIHKSLEELIRQKRREALIASAGSSALSWTPKTFHRWRHQK